VFSKNPRIFLIIFSPDPYCGTARQIKRGIGPNNAAVIGIGRLRRRAMPV
jgi:hypothetical protein